MSVAQGMAHGPGPGGTIGAVPFTTPVRFAPIEMAAHVVEGLFIRPMWILRGVAAPLLRW